jgi:hypothetical protein
MKQEQAKMHVVSYAECWSKFERPDVDPSSLGREAVSMPQSPTLSDRSELGCDLREEPSPISVLESVISFDKGSGLKQPLLQDFRFTPNTMTRSESQSSLLDWELMDIALAPPQLLRMTNQEDGRISRPSDPVAGFLLSQC